MRRLFMALLLTVLPALPAVLLPAILPPAPVAAQWFPFFGFRARTFQQLVQETTTETTKTKGSHMPSANCSLRLKLIVYKDNSDQKAWDILVFLSCPTGNDKVVTAHWQRSTKEMLDRVGAILEEWDPNMPIRVDIR